MDTAADGNSRGFIRGANLLAGAKSGWAVCKVSRPGTFEEYESNAALIVAAVNQFDALNAVAEAASELCKWNIVLSKDEDIRPAVKKLREALEKLNAIRSQI